MTHPLVQEAAKKASIGWFAVDGGPAYALWCLAIAGDVYIVTGQGEQDLPGISEESSVSVTLRGDHGGAIVTYPALATRVRPEAELWESIAPQLAGKRLNASGNAEQVVRRWSRECAVWALSQAGDPLPQDFSSAAAAPRPTPAVSATPKPFRLHRVARRRA